jgi:hypothetical protein
MTYVDVILAAMPLVNLLGLGLLALFHVKNANVIMSALDKLAADAANAGKGPITLATGSNLLADAEAAAQAAGLKVLVGVIAFGLAVSVMACTPAQDSQVLADVNAGCRIATEAEVLDPDIAKHNPKLVDGQLLLCDDAGALAANQAAADLQAQHPTTPAQ